MDESLGKCLSASRIKQGLSIGEVAGITRISEKFIRSVEDDKFDQLPGNVFIKGFLRTYAKQLGMDGDELVARYNSLHIEHGDHAPDLISIPLRPKSSSLPLIALVILLIALGAIVYYQINEIAFLSQKMGLRQEKDSKLEPAKVDKSQNGKENETIGGRHKLNKPEKTKILNGAAPENKNNLITRKKPAVALKPKQSKPAEEKKKRVNVVIP